MNAYNLYHQWAQTDFHFSFCKLFNYLIPEMCSFELQYSLPHDVVLYHLTRLGHITSIDIFINILYASVSCICAGIYQYETGN